MNDQWGNACSYIQSIYAGPFATGGIPFSPKYLILSLIFIYLAIPEGCGFTLQSRGSAFSLDRSHPNALEVCGNIRSESKPFR